MLFQNFKFSKNLFRRNPYIGWMPSDLLGTTGPKLNHRMVFGIKGGGGGGGSVVILNSNSMMLLQPDGWI